MYDEREIKQILKRAFELQNRSESLGSDETDKRLTLEEIEEIARSSGLSVEFVRQAALEYEGIPIEEPVFLDTGNNFELELLGTARGKLDQKTWAELRAMIEYHFDSLGKVKRRPQSIIWKATPGGILKFLQSRKSPTVEISSEETGSRVTVRIRKSLKTYNKLFWPVYGLLGGAAALSGIGLTEGIPEMIPLIVGFLVAAKLFHHWAGRKKQKARDRLQEIAEQLQTIIIRRSTTFDPDLENTLDTGPGQKQITDKMEDTTDAEHEMDPVNPEKLSKRVNG